MKPLSVINAEAIENLRSLSPDDGDVFLREIITIFIEDTPVRIAELHNNVSADKIEAFIRAAHSIKGSASNVGATELREVAERLETYARKHGSAKSESTVAEMETAFTRAREALQRLLSP